MIIFFISGFRRFPAPLPPVLAYSTALIRSFHRSDTDFIKATKFAVASPVIKSEKLVIREKHSKEFAKGAGPIAEADKILPVFLKQGAIVF